MNVGECRNVVDFVGNEMSIGGGLGIECRETCISRQKSENPIKKYRSARLNFVLLLREGDSLKILEFLNPPEIRNSIQSEISSMRNNAFGNVETYYQKLKKRVAEYGY
ncbi:MAG: hypothetical protein COB02_12365 [Candidatus Cloacimonadota bacterium]|nr:MAG: hypothetical protein COB02_12365 [Candidatus Cloacimonadota bacterium]